MQRLLGLVRKAVDNYKMISEGDSIAVGVSGGKDSLVTLTALSSLAKFYPKRFELYAVSIDAGFGLDYSAISEYCARLGIEYTVIRTDIKEIVFDIRKEKHPCSLCAKLRRGAINDAARSLGCNKVAYGHHLDDAVETFLMSLFYEGRISCFSPVTHLDRSGITVIRPLIYCDEWRCSKLARELSLPVAEKVCPADGNTKREETKELIRGLREKFPELKERILTAMQRGGVPEWKPE